jgi:DNA-binding transcriptional LysR family regulator
VSGKVSSRDFNSASYCTHRGHGIGLLPFNYCNELIERGELVRILPDWASPKTSSWRLTAVVVLV